MILTIDIGNTNVCLTIFSANKIVKTLTHNTDPLKQSSNLNKILIKNFVLRFKISGVIISSVVPELDEIFRLNIKKILSIYPIFVSDLKPRLKIQTLIKSKKEIGSDRLVNVIYSLNLFKPPILIVDLGTATTIDYLNKKSIYEGGIIAPGIDLSLNSLFKYTSKLPLIKFKKTRSIIGNNTKNAIKSGFYWGYISLINGLIKKIKDEKKINPKIVLTGGNCFHFKDLIDGVCLIDRFFIVKGLNYIYNCKIKNE